MAQIKNRIWHLVHSGCTNAAAITFIIVLIVAFFLFATSCKTSKKITEKNTQKDSIVYVHTKSTDTVRILDLKTIEVPIKSIVEIPIECDSMGIVNDFKYLFETDKQSTEVSSKGGKLYIDYSKDAYVNSMLSEYRSKEKEEDSTSNVKVEIIHKEKVTVYKTFWQSLMNNIWFFISVALFILWVFGLTPKFILKKIM